MEIHHNFALTSLARDNIIKEGRDEKTIWVTGNTAIDAMKMTVRADIHILSLDGLQIRG